MQILLTRAEFEKLKRKMKKLQKENKELTKLVKELKSTSTFSVRSVILQIFANFKFRKTGTEKIFM